MQEGILKSIHKIKTFIFVLAVVMIIIVSIVSNVQFQRIVKSNAWVVHTYQVMQTLDELQRNLTIAESQANNYLSTGNAGYLKAINDRIFGARQDLSSLIALTGDNATQAEHVRELNEEVNKRIDVVNNMVQLRNKNQLNTLSAQDEIKAAENLDNQLESLSEKAREVEVGLLMQRNGDLTHNVTISTRINQITYSVSIFFLIVSLYMFLTELRRSIKAEKAVKSIQRQLKSIMDSASDMVAVMDTDFRFMLFNEAYANEFKNVFGKQLSVGMNVYEALDQVPEIRDKAIALYRDSFMKQNEIKNIELTINDEIHTFEISSNVAKDDVGDVVATVQIVRDITLRIKEQRELKESYEQLNQAMAELKEKSDKTHLLLEMSDVMLACSSARELGKVMTTYCDKALPFTNGILFIMPPSKDRLEECAKWGNLITREVNFTVEQCWALRMGHIHYVDDAHTRLMCEHVNTDKPGELNYICVPLRAQNDIYGVLYVEILPKNDRKALLDSERLLLTTFAEVAAISLANVRLRENLRMQSMCDPLTGLYNRRYLGEFLLKQIYQSERTKMPITVMMLDLDHFKKINDVYGHDAGDVALKEFSQVLRNNIRPGDFAGRYGGEEFIVVLYNMNGDDASKRAESIRKALPLLKVRHAGEDIGPLTVSIGVAVYPEAGRTCAELIEIADKSLYMAKKTGRNKVVLFTELNKVSELDPFS